MNTDRIAWVDTAKGIAIILVVFGHIFRGVHDAGFRIDEQLYILIDSVVYSFHMHLFFFLSGLFFYQSYQKHQSKIIFSKLDTLIYPFILWSLLQGGIEVLFSGYTNGNLRTEDIFSLFWEPRAQFWFLYTLFLVFLIVTIFYSLFSNKGIYTLFIISMILYLNINYFKPFLIPLYIFTYLPFFLLGILFSRFFSNLTFENPKILFVLFIFFILAQYLFHSTFGLNFQILGISSFIVSLVSVLFFISAAQFLSKKRVDFLTFIGINSMAIYLMHIIFGAGIRIFLDRVFGIDSFIFHILFGLIAGVGLPLVILFFINRFNIKYIFSAPISSFILMFFRGR